MRDQYQDGLKLLLVAAGCVLLVACGNLANLMLARGLKDRAQTSVRVALGASRRRLVRKALVESVLLAVIGGALGIGVAYAGTRLILLSGFHRSAVPTTTCPIDATPSWPVLLFTLGMSVLTGIIFGIAPAWMTSHVDPVEAMREQQAVPSRGGGSIAQKALVSGKRRCRWFCSPPPLFLARACAICSTRISASRPMGVISSPSTPARQLQARTNGAVLPPRR